MKNSVIMIVDNERALSQNLEKRLIEHGFKVVFRLFKAGPFQLLQQHKPDLVIVANFHKNRGLKVVRQIRRWDTKLPVIVVASQSSEELIVQSFRAGVNDYFKEPFVFEAILSSIRQHLNPSSKIFPKARNRICKDCKMHFMIGDSTLMRKIVDYLLKVALTDATVLITGETGTGKELAAELIHRHSPRSQCPFVCVNCPAIPENLIEDEMFGHEKGTFTGAINDRKGKFELAEGGTLFLDEIGEMTLFAQAKILRAIEKKEICRLGGKGNLPLDVRIICATNKELEQLMKDGKFRVDLFYRLNVAQVHLPPLRERKEDIALLIDHFIGEQNCRFGRKIKGFVEENLFFLLRYDWPGNVRELKNLVEASFIDLPARDVEFMDLPPRFKMGLKERQGAPHHERRCMVDALMETNWNKSRAARKLNCSRMTIYRKMARYNIREKRNPER